MFPQSKEDVWGYRCFLCSCPLPTMGASNSDNHKVGMEIVFKYLLAGCQEVNLKKSLISSTSLFEVCNSCDQVTTNILHLHLQLEVLQMKIIEKVKKVKTLVSANWEHGMELEDECGRKKRRKLTMGVDSGDKGDQDFSNKSHLRAQFQALICENDRRQVEIPLVYLEKFAGSGHLPQSISNSPHVPAQVVDHFKNDVATQDCSLKVGTHLGDRDHTDTMLPESVSVETTKSQSQQVHLNEDIKKGEDPRDPLSPLNSSDHYNSEDEGTDAEVNSLSEEKSRQLLTTPAQKVLRRSKILKRERGGKKCGCMYLCHQCLFVSGNSVELEFHYRSKHETGDKEKSHECPQCSAKFSTEPALALHIHVRHNPLMKRVAVCDLCENFSTKSKNCWEAHLNRVHPHDKRFKCDFCGLWFLTYIKLIEHSKSRHPFKKLKCDFCPNNREEGEGPLFTLQEQLPRHLDEVHGISKFRLECDIPGCSQRYYFPHKLKKHKERVHQTSFQCEKCSLNFSSYSAFLRHNVDVHHLNKSRKCDMCPQRFNYAGALLTHKIVEHNFPALRCELCPSTSAESFTSNQALRIHRLHCHPDHEQKGGFGCSVCSKQFKSEALRKEHELRHATTKDFSCDKCDFVTTTKGNLQKHSNRRHSTTGFSCEICGFLTMAKANLRTHMRRHEKPYECSECHKKFGGMSDLKQHMHTHGEERNFQCHLCGRSFKHKPSLMLHNRNEHSKKRMGAE